MREVFCDVPVQPCQWLKREHVVRHLPKGQQALWQRKLQTAYMHAPYADAKRAWQAPLKELTTINVFAARSLEDTLTLHRLGVYSARGISFKPTNLIASVMARLEAKAQPHHALAHERSEVALVRGHTAARRATISPRARLSVVTLTATCARRQHQHPITRT